MTRRTDPEPLLTVPVVAPRRPLWWTVKARTQCDMLFGVTCDAETLGEAVQRLHAIAGWRGLTVRAIVSARQV